MTNLEALQSFPEFDGLSANLLAKSLTDAGITSGDNYSAGQEQNLDLCAADIYLLMSAMPEYREGTQSEKWNAKACLTARLNLYRKHGLTPPEQSAVSFGINGRALR